MPEAWVKTTSVNLAAALSTLGVALRTDQTTDTISGREWKTILLSLESIPTEDIGLIEDTGEPGREPVVKTRLIMEMIRTGKLEKADPAHPVLDALRALHNRERLCAWLKHDERHRIAKTSHAPRSILAPGEEPPAVKQAATLFKSGDIKVVAALAVFGVPVARIEGSSDRHTFLCANTGHDLGVPPMDAHATVCAYRHDTLPEDHPFRWAMQALINRERILDHLFHQRKMLLIRKPGSGLGALVAEKHNHECMDKVRKHFRIV